MAYESSRDMSASRMNVIELARTRSPFGCRDDVGFDFFLVFRFVATGGARDWLLAMTGGGVQFDPMGTASVQEVIAVVSLKA